VGLILYSEKDAAAAHYSVGNLSNQVLAPEYQLTLRDEADLAATSTGSSTRTFSSVHSRLT
jgi:hypothetical protein